MSRFTFQDCADVQHHLRRLLFTGDESSFYSKPYFDHLWAAEHRKRHPHEGRQTHSLSVRIGDFDALNTHGSMFDVRCVKCGLAGTISIPEKDFLRTQCPRCHHIPESLWQVKGWAGLLKPEKPKVKLPQSVTVDSIEDDEDHTIIEEKSDVIAEEGVLEIAPEPQPECDEFGMPAPEEDEAQPVACVEGDE
jgi:hypothetical protein